MSILSVDRDHDIRQDKLLTALIVSIIVHIFLFIFFSQLAPLYRTPGIIKKNYEVLLLGKADRESKGEELTKEKEDKEKKEEELLKVREEAEIEETPSPPPPPPKEIVKEEPPAPPVAEPLPPSVEAAPEPVKKVVTSEPSPVKAKSIPPKEKTSREKVVEKKAQKPEKTVYSSTSDDAEKKAPAKAVNNTTGGAKAGAPVPAGQSYMELIKALVVKNLKYPPAAKINRIEGNVSVSFLISKDGDSMDVNIKRSSGYPILDDGALRAIRKSEPFPSFDNAEDVLIVHMGGEQYASVSFKISFTLDYISMGAE
ncbi:MAG: energy transducer TonB [Deltaproteobacteria bacterium]|nr:energy transducer TonB [Deltaproteobacteria bacterium]